MTNTNSETPGLLGDTAERDYHAKLERFNRFAEPELRAAIAELGLRGGDWVLDAGCGAGLTTAWLAEQVMPGGVAVGIDLAAAHVRRARSNAPQAQIIQSDLLHVPFGTEAFNLVWNVNTINHLRDPAAGVGTMLDLLKPGGRLVLGQSHFLPEMVFAWDMRLERVVTEACRRYYRDRYGLDERDTSGIRRLVGLLRDAGLNRIWTRTVAVERIAPLDAASIDYIDAAIFHGYWGEKLQPYLTSEDWLELSGLTNRQNPAYCLLRSDFHYIQTLTLVGGIR